MLSSKKKGATEQQEHVGNRNGLKKDNLITLEAIMTNYDYDLGGDYDWGEFLLCRQVGVAVALHHLRG